MDSSTVVALAKEATDISLNTFSYRCAGESFDESHYARLMAKNTGAIHHEVEYSAHDVLSMTEIVREMNEPFCNVGINIATYILGKEATQKVSYVLTGDGGDELFGGHPVYEADKIARFADALPNILKKPFIGLSTLLPDSDKKKNFVVKIKRFSENLGLPVELLSHRWRIYYNSNELSQLLTTSFADGLNGVSLYEDILQFNNEADGPDLLSRILYSDYQTEVDFYLRRNDLNRRFCLETHFPLLDYRLVEYCAAIPSHMKIKGWFDTKYIFKKAMEKVLPHSIVYRKDKLGHSIPLKNWIRDNNEVRQFILDFISEDAIQKRGFFTYSYVHKLIKDHMAKRRNNSHRLWALAVLEMWLREHSINSI
jgi:asparagine synthase (glutamine-hydrolysing)